MTTDIGDGAVMADLMKLLVALVVVGALAIVMANSVIPMIVLACVGYSLFYVWRGLTS